MSVKAALVLLVVVAALTAAHASAVRVESSAARRHLLREQRSALSSGSALQLDSSTSTSTSTSVSLAAAMRLSFDAIGEEIRNYANTVKTRVVALFPTSLIAAMRGHISGFISRIQRVGTDLRKFISSAVTSLTSVFSCPLPQRIVEINQVAAAKLGFAPLNEPIYCSYKSAVQGLSGVLPRIATWDTRLLFGRLESIPSLYLPDALLEVSESSKTGAVAVAGAGASAAAGALANRINCNAVMTAVVVVESIVALMDDVVNAIDNSLTASDPVQLVICIIGGVAQLIMSALKGTCTSISNTGQWNQR